MPPLRDRREDLSELIWLFVNQFAHEANRQITGIDSTSFELMNACSWPGNIRQLRNVVRTAMILGKGPVLSITTVPWLIDELRMETSCESQMCGGFGGVSLEELERIAILETLDQAQGNHAQAARVLGISDRTLRDKVKKYRQQEYMQPV